MYRTIVWSDSGVVMIDQRILPVREEYLTFKTSSEVAAAIKEMVIRGAPAIGVAAAMGIALGMKTIPPTLTQSEMDSMFEKICEEMAATRPTAVNLFWAIERMTEVYKLHRGLRLTEIQLALIEAAKSIHRKDIESNQQLGKFGQELFDREVTILTHCNAGGLATGGYGTAIGVIRAAFDRKKVKRVFADETRPFLQGARLTAWELKKLNIPVTVITDNMAGYFMAKGEIDAVVVGADRIAANGDTANKIGTYMVAVLAAEHGLPFYVAAPLSTIDFDTDSGGGIPIEERPAREVSHVGENQLTPDGVTIANPAFDVTPNKFVTAIITDLGVAHPPFKESLANLRSQQD